ALLEAGYKPDAIEGDMDSVSDRALRSGAELLVHAYPGGTAPGSERLEQLGLACLTVPATGISEELALLLASEEGAELTRPVADPHSMARWWPGIEGVTPDRRGFAPGARWAVHGDDKPSLMRKPHHSGGLVMLKVRPPEFAAWHLTGERFDVELTLEEAEEGL